jgi:hypothetical protein
MTSSHNFQLFCNLTLKWHRKSTNFHVLDFEPFPHFILLRSFILVIKMTWGCVEWGFGSWDSPKGLRNLGRALREWILRPHEKWARINDMILVQVQTQFWPTVWNENLSEKSNLSCYNHVMCKNVQIYFRLFHLSTHESPHAIVSIFLIVCVCIVRTTSSLWLRLMTYHDIVTNIDSCVRLHRPMTTSYLFRSAWQAYKLTTQQCGQ